MLKDDVMSLDSSTSVLSKLSISTRDVISSTSSISDDDTVAVTATPKKRKMNEGITGNNQLHPDLQHVRKSERIVDKMKSKLHCTTHQAIGAVVEVANGMFNCQWKYHDEDKETYDLDTVPHHKNIREARKAVTALTLASMVAQTSQHSSSQHKTSLNLYLLKDSTDLYTWLLLSCISDLLQIY